MDSFPPSEREWLLKVVRESEQRTANKMRMLADEFAGVEERCEALEMNQLQARQVGTRAGAKAGVNAGVLVSAIVAIVMKVLEAWQ